MSRHRAFRPACPDMLEGRIAPSLTAPHLQAPAAHVKPAHDSSVQSAINTVKKINWDKIGDQVTSFFGFHHPAKATPRPSTSHTNAHTLTR